jgi:hypothetical protein
MPRPSLRYTLVDRQVVPCPDAAQHARDLDDESKCRVALTVLDDVEVSTVFVGIDTSLSTAERPLVFETMLFVGGDATEHHRYATWEEAEAGHRKICADLAVWAKQPTPRQ